MGDRDGGRGGAASARPQIERVPAVVALLAGSVVLSRVLGYVREAVLAYQIGVSAETDAYRAAFLIPDILNHFLAGGALAIAFIPFYTRVRAESGSAAAERLLATVLGTTGVIAVAGTALLWWQVDALVAWGFPGFDLENQRLTARLTRILLPAQVFFIAGGVIRGALMAHDRFSSQALAPLLYNAAIIAGGVLLGQRLGAEGFAWGALVGAVLGPFLVPWLDALRSGAVRIGFRVAPRDPELLRYLLIATPLMLGLSMLTVDEWYDKLFGARLGTGIVALLGYARQLMLVPVAVVGQTIATAALPVFSQLWADGRREELNRILLQTLRASLALAVLAGAGFALFAGPIVALIYERGRFTAQNSADVAGLLAIFALAVPAWVTQQVAVRAFFARGDTWRPMLLGTGAALLAVPLYWVLGRGYGAAGVAAAGVIAMSASAIATLLLARWLHGAPPLLELVATGSRSLGVAILAALAVLLFRSTVGEPGRLLELGVGGTLFGLTALAGIYAIGDAPMRDGVARIWRRIRRG